jgi:putative PIN family toxin of toxin-antitoxin system
VRVILDTNVWLAALMRADTPPHAIYRAWLSGRFEVVTSSAQLDEMRRVSRDTKFKRALPAHRVGTMINNMLRAIVLDVLPALPRGVEARDPDDSFLLAMALEGNADYLVTGDRRAGLLERGSFGRTRILTPTRFCAEAL